MKLACNIDAKGRAVRRVGGAIMGVTGLALLAIWAIPGGGVCAWMGSLMLIATGAFCVFEAQSGWCAVRALGFKTRV